MASRQRLNRLKWDGCLVLGMLLQDSDDGIGISVITELRRTAPP